MCSDFATFIGDRSWHPHWDKRWQTPYPRSPAMVDPLWASMSAEGWRATKTIHDPYQLIDPNEQVDHKALGMADGCDDFLRICIFWNILEQPGRWKHACPILVDQGSFHWTLDKHEQFRHIEIQYTDILWEIVEAALAWKKPASLFPTSMAPRGGRVFLCSKGHPFLPVFRSWPKGPKADSIMDGFDASLGSFQVLLQVFAASIQQLEHPGSWNSRRPCLEAVLGWWWCLSLELQWGV